jgi:hypothetical protein
MLATVSRKKKTTNATRRIAFFVGRPTDVQKRFVCGETGLVGNILSAVMFLAITVFGGFMAYHGITDRIMVGDIADGVVGTTMGYAIAAFGVVFFIWSLVLVHRAIAARKWHPTEQSARYAYITGDKATGLCEKPFALLIKDLGELTWTRVKNEIDAGTDLGGALNYELATLVDDTYRTFIDPPNGILPGEGTADEVLAGMVTRTVSAINNLFNREKARQHRRTEERHAVQIARQDGNALVSKRLIAQLSAGVESTAPMTT